MLAQHPGPSAMGPNWLLVKARKGRSRAVWVVPSLKLLPPKRALGERSPDLQVDITTRIECQCAADSPAATFRVIRQPQPRTRMAQLALKAPCLSLEASASPSLEQRSHFEPALTLIELVGTGARAFDLGSRGVLTE
jgi:hypothetical protein